MKRIGGHFLFKGLADMAAAIVALLNHAWLTTRGFLSRRWSHLQLMFSAFTTVLLVIISYLQYETMRRQVGLEYSKENPVLYATINDIARVKTLEGFSYQGVKSLPARFNIYSNNSSLSIVRIETWAIISYRLTTIENTEQGCYLVVPNFYIRETRDTVGLSIGAKRMFAEGLFNSNEKETAKYSITLDAILMWVTAIDVFGKERAYEFNFQSQESVSDGQFVQNGVVAEEAGDGAGIRPVIDDFISGRNARSAGRMLMFDEPEAGVNNIFGRFQDSREDNVCQGQMGLSDGSYFKNVLGSVAPELPPPPPPTD